MNKKAIGLVLVGIIAGSSITAFAAGGRKIEVFDNVKKVIVNKINKPFTKGEEPFTYNGRTYVPLRYISEALGENVDWDGKTGTVYIGDRYSTSAHYWNKEIMHMSYKGSFSYDHNSDEYRENNIGEKFSNYLEVIDVKNSSTSFVEFPLNGQYKKFTARAGYMKKYMNAAEVNVKILLDDKVKYETVFKQGSMPKDISIDLTGANKIKFQIDIPSYADSNASGIIFGNGQFIK